MSLARVGVIARNVFLEVIRDRILYLVALFALLLVAATLLLPEVSAGAQDKITLDLGLAAIHLLSVVVAVFVGTGLVNKEIEKKTVLVLIAKPVSRLEFVIGKHLGLVGVLAVLIGLLTVIFLAVLSLNRIDYPLGSLLISVAFMALEGMLLTAVAILFGVFTSSLLATLLTFAIYLMGHLSQDIVALGQLSENPSLQRLTDGLYLVLPDLERLNLRNEAIYGMELLPPLPELLGHLLYALVYTLLLLAIAIAIFSRRQF
ncbi:ABC transporter protein [Halomicronema hongdechloris C2206]|uniref:ABC transporter protein n=1 Tax=Halomicronema hongdechloris C2206 TaxID=1641165 RepID=A0A1Z3HT64_9CYAN|nr:ABC transporter permease [Halomicronema hongdechloris]ASC73499.1 ABC transporter protein [Halomicronema hongdechloris C2206]